jgi:hypothetical protein
LLSDGCRANSVNGKGFHRASTVDDFAKTRLMKNTEIKPFYIDRDGTFVDSANWTIKGFLLNDVLGKDTFLAPKGTIFTSINKR